MKSSAVALFAAVLVSLAAPAAIAQDVSPQQPFIDPQARAMALGVRVGVTDGSPVPAGQVGELLSAQTPAASAVTLSSSTPTNVVSLTLTAGDWDCRGVIDFPLTLATLSQIQVGTSLTSGTIGPQDTFITLPLVTSLLTATPSAVIPATRYYASTPQTVYLVASASFSLGTAKAYGTVACRRAH